MFERARKGERALLIQPHPPGRVDADRMEEFAELARSAGATVVGSVSARVEKPHPAYYVGTGKLEEVLAACEAGAADLVLFNEQLSPGQERNLERALKRRVVDRTGLILDIFAQRAASHEGKLQVELAQLKHWATRLVRGWTHLERQRGGAIGLRGPGEKQLELDKRILQRKIESLQGRLDKVQVQRGQMRRARLRNDVPRVALVGYTNAGKSTLFNRLTGAGVYADDRLFATLDPTTRRVEGVAPLVLSDTVGFVRDLPHELVAAFRSTLSEARDADLLLHVVDAADEHRDERILQVDAVLAEIGAGDIPQVLVFNKIDRLAGLAARRDPEIGGRERIWLSALGGEGLGLLREALAERFLDRRLAGELELGPGDGRLRARLHEAGAVKAERSREQGGWCLRVDLPRAVAERLAAEPGGQALRPLLLVAPAAPTYNPRTH
ncbi:ribosome rescue GTPase HflX [Arenimonas fontis]|uniref:GTPase HflX n=1 Tax=Arenimonas fontis TaxID=2608255 RepID=A0A5B2ZCM1_9GAMM|nr:ribosome rescue GTPase HflX [Arenimonas fontis]KAA2285747.1 GTPase HflX [Arenimonas fontis]